MKQALPTKIIGDLNIDINTAGIEVDKLDRFCNLFKLTNLITTETCCTKNHISTIDLFPTNRTLSFQKTRVTETGISDYHKFISKFSKSRYTHFKARIIHYKTIRILTWSFFLKILKIRTFQQTLTICTRTILISCKHFLKLPKTVLRSKRRFSGEIMHLLSTENLGKNCINEVVWETNFGKVRLRKMNFHLKPKETNVSHCGESVLNHFFQDVTKEGLVTNRSFWSFVKPFLTNKSCYTKWYNANW